MPLPKKNTAYSFVVGLVDQSNRPSFKANPTIASGDFKHSGDGSALANLTNLPAADPASSRLVKIVLTAAEMNYDRVCIQCVDAAGAEWDDVIVYIDTTTRNVDDLCFPTTSGRSIDVTVDGEVGLDWANVGSPTTAVNLSGTTVKTATDVETDTADIQSRLPAALGANGNMKADVRDYSGTAGTFSGGRPEVNTTHWGGTAVASAVVGANMVQVSGDATAADNLEAALDGTGSVTITAAITGNITGNLSGSVGSVTGAVGSVTGNVGGNVTGSVGSLATQAKADVQAEAEEALQTYHLDHLIASADPGSIVANSSLWAALTSKSATPNYSTYNNQTDSQEAMRDRGDAAWITATGFSTHSAADVWSAGTRTLTALGFTLGASDIGTGAIDADALAADVITDIWQGTALTEAYATDGSTATPAQLLYMIWSALSEFSISGTTITAKKLDGSTTAMTFTLDSSTTPSSRTRAS